MFVQVVASVFDLMTTYARVWSDKREVQSVPLFGFPHGVASSRSLSTRRMVRVFASGQGPRRDLEPLMSPRTLSDLLADRANEEADTRFLTAYGSGCVRGGSRYSRRGYPVSSSCFTRCRSISGAPLIRSETADSSAVRGRRDDWASGGQYLRQKPELLRGLELTEAAYVGGILGEVIRRTSAASWTPRLPSARTGRDAAHPRCGRPRGLAVRVLVRLTFRGSVLIASLSASASPWCSEREVSRAPLDVLAGACSPGARLAPSSCSHRSARPPRRDGPDQPDLRLPAAAADRGSDPPLGALVSAFVRAAC